MFIKVNDLKKSYGNGRMSAEILKGVSFEVKVGEILTVLGPSDLYISFTIWCRI